MTPTAGPSLGPLHSPSLRDRDRAEARARRNPLVWLREILVIIVVALIISTLLRAFIVQVFWIPSPRCTTRSSKMTASPCRASMP